MARKRAEIKSKKTFKGNRSKVLAVITIIIIIAILGTAMTFYDSSEEDQNGDNDSDVGDSNGKWFFAMDTSSAQVGSYYSTGYIPTLVIIDVNGDIIHLEAGVHTKAQLMDYVQQAQNPSSSQSLGPAPDFTLQTLGSKTFKLSENEGKVVILDLMAVSCPPCHQQMPELQKIKEELSDDIVILSIDVYGASGSETANEVRNAFGEYIKE